MLIKGLSGKQKEFLKNVFELEELPEDKELKEFLEEKGSALYECKGCGKLIFHDNYEFWNIMDCCDDNSKLVEGEVLCEVCYARTPENLKDWIFFRPTWYQKVDFEK